METRISNTIREWIPEASIFFNDTEEFNKNLTDYVLLRQLAESCLSKINSSVENEVQQVEEILKVINILYQGGNQYERNAIENEFLSVLMMEESPRSFKKHLDIFPSELRKGYIKAILEN